MSLMPLKGRSAFARGRLVFIDATFLPCLRRISGRGRPITLAFRQLHAAVDPEDSRRYWQGFLRLKTGLILYNRIAVCIYSKRSIPTDMEQCTPRYFQAVSQWKPYIRGGIMFFLDKKIRDDQESAYDGSSLDSKEKKGFTAYRFTGPPETPRLGAVRTTLCVVVHIVAGIYRLSQREFGTRWGGRCPLQCYVCVFESVGVLRQMDNLHCLCATIRG